MTSTMRAAVAEALKQPLVLRDVPVPEPAAGQVLVRIVGSGVCHTDLHTIDGDWPMRVRLPLVPGHEAAGYVAALGPGVAGFKEGDRVGIPWLYSACGVCELCLTGRETLCPKQQNTGYSVNGGYADYAVAPAAYVGRLPDNVDLAAVAPILCAGVTTYKGLKETGVKAGEWVAISGIGGTGHIAVQYAKAMGLAVVALDVDDAKLAHAKELGADIVFHAERDLPVNKVLRLTGGGVHGAVVTAVSLKAMEQTLAMLRRGGTGVMTGIPPGKVAASVFDVVVKGLTIRGSIVGTRQDLNDALWFVANGKVSAAVEEQPLEAVNAVLDRLRGGQVHGRVVLRMAA
jgi:alcohol dehydrogenase, propanol-preferring